MESRCATTDDLIYNPTALKDCDNMLRLDTASLMTARPMSISSPQDAAKLTFIMNKKTPTHHHATPELSAFQAGNLLLQRRSHYDSDEEVVSPYSRDDLSSIPSSSPSDLDGNEHEGSESGDEFFAVDGDNTVADERDIIEDLLEQINARELVLDLECRTAVTKQFARPVGPVELIAVSRPNGRERHLKLRRRSALAEKKSSWSSSCARSLRLSTTTDDDKTSLSSKSSKSFSLEIPAELVAVPGTLQRNVSQKSPSRLTLLSTTTTHAVTKTPAGLARTKSASRRRRSKFPSLQVLASETDLSLQSSSILSTNYASLTSPQEERDSIKTNETATSSPQSTKRSTKSNVSPLIRTLRDRLSTRHTTKRPSAPLPVPITVTTNLSSSTSDISPAKAATSRRASFLSLSRRTTSASGPSGLRNLKLSSRSTTLLPDLLKSRTSSHVPTMPLIPRGANERAPSPIIPPFPFDGDASDWGAIGTTDEDSVSVASVSIYEEALEGDVVGNDAKITSSCTPSSSLPLLKEEGNGLVPSASSDLIPAPTTDAAAPRTPPLARVASQRKDSLLSPLEQEGSKKT